MIRHIFLTIGLILIGTSGFSQQFAEATTEQHQLVNGTNIYMVPPESFSPSANFKGFQNPEDQTSMIMIMEIPGPFSKVSEGFNEEMMLLRGMYLQSKSEVQLSSYEGMLIKLDQSANGLDFSKHLLVYGDESSTTMINAVFLKDSVELGEQLETSILSTVIDAEMKADPRAALAYTVDETVGGLQFHSVVGNAMIFNRDLKTPTESEDKAALVVDRSYAKVEIDDTEAFLRTRLQQFPDDYSVQAENGTGDIQLDGLEGHWLIADNEGDDTEKLYLVMLFDEEGGYYLFAGTYHKDHPQAQTDMQKIVETFERK